MAISDRDVPCGCPWLALSLWGWAFGVRALEFGSASPVSAGRSQRVLRDIAQVAGAPTGFVHYPGAGPVPPLHIPHVNTQSGSASDAARGFTPVPPASGRGGRTTPATARTVSNRVPAPPSRDGRCGCWRDVCWCLRDVASCRSACASVSPCSDVTTVVVLVASPRV